MKRFFFLLLAMAALTLQANPVDKQLAREVGAKFLYANTLLKSDNASELHWVSTYRTTRGEEAFYVFNHSQGFVIVSADDCATPVLAYSDEGAFDPDRVPVQMEEYLQHFVEQIQFGIENHLEADEETARQWVMVKATGYLSDHRGTTSVAPLLNNTWGQGCYYNSLCPEDPNSSSCGHVVTGCVATSMAQIMHYWSYPSTGTGSHSYTPSGYPQQSVNFGATTYQWNNMPNSLSSSSTTAQINAVATLLWHCGVAVEMMYGPGASSAYSENVFSALLNYFGYSNELTSAYKDYYTNTAWLNMIKSNLDLSFPIHYSGNGGYGTSGHAFVCDGYDVNDMLHFNWGWEGYCNDSYFALDALTPSSYNFSYGNYAIFNIHPPVNPGITYQVTASASPASGGTVTGAGGYQAYELCTLTATPASGFSFIGWKEGESILSTETSYSFIVKQNRNLVAVFSMLPVCAVSAAYYPDATDQASSSVQVSWETLVSQSWDFETDLEGWTTIDADGDGYAWEQTSGDGIITHSGNGVAASASYINNVGALTPDNWLVSPQIPLDGILSFWAAGQDPSWAQEHFAVYVSTSGTAVNNFTQVMSETVATGNMTQYTVDLSAYSGNGFVAIRHFNVTDMFRLNVDDVTLSNGEAPYPPLASLYAGFESGIPNDWTRIDADGDGYQWDISGFMAHNSGSCISSASFVNNVGALNPDNYLVSPKVALGGVFTFWACAQDASWPSEHFGVAVSTTTNSASAFTTVQQWTMSAKGEPASSPKGTRDQGNWYQYTVNLSNFAGQTGYIAIRHFNCSDMFYLNVDDISYGFGKETPQIQYYRLYRATCENNSPSNAVMVADQLTGTSYVDANWGNLPFGSYMFGVCSVGLGNAESDIIWSNCLDKGVGYTITVTANPSSGGNPYGGGVYEEGTTCTLEARPNQIYDFVKWTQGGVEVSTQESYSFTVTEDAAFVAHYQLKSYTVTVEADPEEGGVVSQGDTYNHGSTCYLSATPNPGYRFVNWTKNGVVISNNASCSFQVTEDAVCVAHFIAQYTVTATPNPEEGGTIVGTTGVFDSGSTVTLTANASEGYDFLNWTEDGVEVCADPEYSFTLTSDRILVANFELRFYQITVLADPVEGGTVSGEATYSHGSTATLTAIPNDNEGYQFVNWTKDGVEVSTITEYIFNVTGPGEYVAHFELKTYEIKLDAEPSEGGTLSGAGMYQHGEEVTISVTPNEHYLFLNWTENGTVVDTALSFTVEVTADRHFVAHLVLIESIDEEADAMLMLYPNPVADKLAIETETPVCQYEIYSITGALLLRVNEGFEKRHELDLKALPAGHYLIRLTTDSSVLTRKFVKR